jgi:hypothetical protein
MVTELGTCRRKAEKTAMSEGAEVLGLEKSWAQ